MNTNSPSLVKTLQKLDHFFTITSRATNFPFAECDPVTFDDQIRIFTFEKDAEKYLSELKETDFPAGISRIERSQMQSFYTGLFLAGINCIVFHDTESCSLPLDSIVAVKKPQQNKAMPPVINESLKLTCLSFLQELRRSGQSSQDAERIRKLRDLEQEIMANLVRSDFILALDVTDMKGPVIPGKTNSNLKVPFLKNPAGNVLQPVFSDLWEFEQFRSRNKRKLQPAVVPFRRLAAALIPDACGCALNPSGFNLVLLKEKLEIMAKQADAEV